MLKHYQRMSYRSEGESELGSGSVESRDARKHSISESEIEDFDMSVDATTDEEGSNGVVETATSPRNSTNKAAAPVNIQDNHPMIEKLYDAFVMINQRLELLQLQVDERSPGKLSALDAKPIALGDDIFSELSHNHRSRRVKRPQQANQLRVSPRHTKKRCHCLN
jgi:hypothetical protein